MGHHVLIIEDDSDIRETLGELLQSEGYAVTVAGDGQEGLESLQSGETPDLVLVDLMMPKMTGKEFIRRSRKLAATRNTPIVVMSALNSTEVSAMNLAADGFLKKPPSVNELLAMTARFCSL